MALRDDGQVQGSVSGDCIEADLIERVLSGGFGSTVPLLLKYGVTPDETHRYGLPCGGIMELAMSRSPGRHGTLPGGWRASERKCGHLDRGLGR